MRLDRNRKGTDIWLGEKMIFFVIGAALGIGGMVTGHDWLIWAAIVVLVIGFVLRLLARRGNGAAPPPEAEQDRDWARAWEPEEEVPREDDTPPDNEPRTR